jgi:putative SOS response-associated peptidase YedK
MCGRFTLRTTYTLLADALGPLDIRPDLPQLPLFNVAPTQTIPVVRDAAGHGRRELVGVRWGLVPSWSRELKGPPLINARCETAADKPAFRTAMKGRRCLVPADGFYEWQAGAGKTKTPHFIHRRDDRPFAFAGLWERWHDDAGHALDSCTILTTGPNALMSRIHDRMPVILDPADYAAWLDPKTPAADIAALLRPAPAEPMEAYPVSTLVNSPKNQGPELVAPVA